MTPVSYCDIVIYDNVYSSEQFKYIQRIFHQLILGVESLSRIYESSLRVTVQFPYFL